MHSYHWATYRLRLLSGEPWRSGIEGFADVCRPSERFAIMANQLEAKKESFGPRNDADGKGGGASPPVARRPGSD